MRIDPEVFAPESVPAATRAATDRLRGGDGDALAVEPPSRLARDRTVDGPGWCVSRGPRVSRWWPSSTGWRLSIRIPPESRTASPRCAGWPRTASASWGTGRLVVGGESAGAHLAALALLALRDSGEIGAVEAANLAYGVYDVSMTPSARRWGSPRIVVNTEDLASFADEYAARKWQRDPDVSPLYADLTGMPTALFSCGTLDPLLDDTLFMAARWEAAGSSAELALYPGAPHEFLNLRNAIAAGAEARERMVAFVDRALESQP